MSYRKGRRWEYAVKFILECNGWTCIRSAASKVVDLVCFKEGRILLVECKRSFHDYVRRQEKIQRLSVKLGLPILVVYRGKKRAEAVEISKNGVRKVNPYCV